jgi:hypothetical protein
MVLMVVMGLGVDRVDQEAVVVAVALAIQDLLTLEVLEAAVPLVIQAVLVIQVTLEIQGRQLLL